MHAHGSESYWILGEGLVSVSGDGDRPAVTGDLSDRRGSGGAAPAADETPAFRFSRMGPRGVGLSLQEHRQDRGGDDRLRGRGGAGIPAGYTYLGQFIDHDLTFDKTTVTLGEAISPAMLEQGRSPTLDLDSLYGNGPLDPDSRRFYAADRQHLRMGSTARIFNDEARDGFDLPRGAGKQRGEEAAGDHPRRAQRREPRRRPDAPRHDPLPQPGARPVAGEASRTTSASPPPGAGS